MQIIQTSDFKKNLAKLPEEIQKLYQIQADRFLAHSYDPRLHVKKVRDLKLAFSFRITRRYRVFFYFQNPDTAIFFMIDHRKDAYRNI
ncbi:MAG: hypothetical protein HYV13_02565 [Candidatus Doudnabacteria bacterium]|nr:hypothetical protein [Candidatus Doudnabacteria bacterium]